MSPTEPLDGLAWRSIGPFRAGRVVAVAGDPARPQVFYMGSTGGGIWKTVDGGIVWENVSDGWFRRASVGAVAVAPSDPNVVYAGMGESCIRGDVSHGDGVYRSNDGGRSWAHLGLAATRHVARVRIDPRDPDTAYVAALGHAHGPNPERGVFRTRDGGRTWRHVLSRRKTAGAIDLSIDPQNPRILYAAFWETVRTPWGLSSGGPGSGIFRSRDGGDTWTELSRRPGLPAGLLGRIGIAASPAQAGRVWAIVEAEDGGVFRSDDGGDTWRALTHDRAVRQRPWYCSHIFADPKDAETVWVLSVAAWRSTDGGTRFEQVAFPHGDHHDLWIDPADPQRMIGGNDGGATVSLNGGESWTPVYNQPTAELYHVATDRQVVYRVYGAQQDHGTISVPSRSPLLGITPAEAYDVGGSEAGYIAVRPDDHNIVFAGSTEPPRYLSRYDHRTGQARYILVWPEFTAGAGAEDAKYRFQWTHPVALSPHDPNVLYVAGNRVFRSTDEGTTWRAISPDLTRNDPTKQGPSGGPITKDNTGAEYYCTIFAFAESPVRRGVLWAGSDDGLVHVSRDDGKTWRNVTPAGLQPWTTISLIEASPHDAGTAYVAAWRYKLDDFRPYLFRTTDYGRTWTKITTGIDADDPTRAIREDPARPGLLYAGTETGVYVSFDRGGHWRRWRGANLPVVPVHDLVVHDSDLVLATHGRSFWIFDDLSPVRELAAAPLARRPRLFAPRPTTRFLTNTGFGHEPLAGKGHRSTGAQTVTYRQREDPETGQRTIEPLNAGKNPPDGVIVTYFLPVAPTGEITLTFRDARRRTIVAFSNRADPAEPRKVRLPARPGLNRFVWDTRYPGAHRIEGTEASMGAFAAGLHGPFAPPGEYRVELRAGGARRTAAFSLRADPRTGATKQDLDEQFALLLAIRDKLSAVHDVVRDLRALRSELEALAAPLAAAGRRRGPAVARFLRELDAIEDALLQRRAVIRQDTLNFPIRLNAKLGAVACTVASADGRPIASAREVFAVLSRRADAQIAKWRKLDARRAAVRRALLG